MHGYFREYYINGQLYADENYRNNKLQDLAHYYFEDGSLASRKLYLDDINIGNALYFHPNGKISSYISYHGQDSEFEGEIFYRSNYDSLGNLTSEKGAYIPTCLASSPKMKKGDNFWIEFYIARPPHLISTFEIVELNNLGDTLFYKAYTNDLQYDMYLFKKKYDESGNYQVYGKLEFSGDASFQDFIKINVEVSD